MASAPAADQGSPQLWRHTRSLLTLKGRPTFRLAGRETYERLANVASVSRDLLAQHDEPRLAHLYQGLQAALAPFAETSQTLHQGAAWLHDIAYSLAPVATYPSHAEDGARPLRGSPDTVQWQSKITPTLEAFGRHLALVNRSYWPALVHYYDVPGLPRTKNELESHFRKTRRHLLRTTGQQGQPQRTLQRQGAWELLPHPSTEATLQETLCQILPADLAQERQRFRVQSRALRRTQAQCDPLRQQWSILPPTGTR